VILSPKRNHRSAMKYRRLRFAGMYVTLARARDEKARGAYVNLLSIRGSIRRVHARSLSSLYAPKFIMPALL